MTNFPNNSPLYLQIRDIFKQKIAAGELKAGDQLATESELVEQYNVSRITIKHALKLLVEEDLVYRIAGKGSFISDPQAAKQKAATKEVSPNRLLTIGFLAPLVNDLFTVELIKGIEKACSSNQVLLVLRMTSTQQEEEEGIRLMLAANVDGMVIFPVDGESYSEAILALKTEGFPFVLVDRYLPGIKTNAITSDNYQGGYLGTEYLIGKGHKKIGILSGTKSKTSSTEERFQGYLDMAKKAGLRLETSHWLTRIDEVSNSDEFESKNLIRNWLIEHPEMTAIFAFSSQIAIYAYSVALQLGRKVPEELAILSFDTPIICDLEGFFFSHLKQQDFRMGEEAVRLLLQAIDDPAAFSQQLIPITLFEGRST